MRSASLPFPRRAAASFNKITGANSRPAAPRDAGPEFESASCAPPFPPAAVAQFYRSAMMMTAWRALRQPERRREKH